MVWTKRVGWPHGASLLSHLYQYCVSCPCNRRGIVGEASRVREGSYRVLSKFTANKRVDRRPVREAWSPPFLRNIQALRGAAAILVMVMHAFSAAKGLYAFRAEQDPFIDVAHQIFWSIGPAGVDIFFVISGFIVLTVAMKSAGDGCNFSIGSAGLFYFRRLTRIYPLYWIVLVATVTSTSLVLPDRWEAIAERPSVILLMARSYDEVPSAWTLTFELYFYSIVALGLLVASQRLLFFVTGWAVLQIALIGIAAASGWQSGINSTSIFVNPLILEFLFGCTIAVAIQWGVSRFAMPALMFGIVMLFIGGSLGWQRGEVLPWERVAVFGVAGALLVYGLVANERNHKLVLRGLGWAGDASYSIYLWHIPLFWTASWTGMSWGIYGSIPRVVTPIIWIAFGLAIGVLSYWFIERPMLAAVRIQSRTRESMHERIDGAALDGGCDVGSRLQTTAHIACCSPRSI
jgi:exopolysaccharide production protein ExoZ